MTDSGDRLKASSAPTADRDHAFDIAFGQRIRTARVAAGMSQSAIARAAGVTFQQVQKYEQGKNRMSVGTLQAIADALGVHPGSFFGEGPKLSSPHQEAGRAQRVAEHIGERVSQLTDPVVIRRLAALVDALAGAKAAKTTGAAKGDGHPSVRDDPEMAN